MITLYYLSLVCDLVTDANKRSEGYGEKLFHIFIYGRMKINTKAFRYLRDYSVQMHTVFMRIRWAITK